MIIPAALLLPVFFEWVVFFVIAALLYFSV